MENFTIQEYSGSRVISDRFSFENKPNIREFMGSIAVQQIVERIGRKCIVVLWGDGTMLRAVQEFHEEGIPFLGINFGTKGFLMNDRAPVEISSDFISNSYPLLDTTVTTESGTSGHVAFNEVQVKATSGSLIDINFTINGMVSVNLKGDGMLIATPAGSTAYNQSAGGPILPHESPIFVATPLLTFEPKGIRPIPFVNTQTVTIRNNPGRPRPLSVFADTTALLRDGIEDVIIQVSKCQHSVELLIAKEYESVWRSKIFEEQGMIRI